MAAVDNMGVLNAGYSDADHNFALLGCAVDHRPTTTIAFQNPLLPKQMGRKVGEA